MDKRDMVGKWMYLVTCGMGSRWGYLEDLRLGEGEDLEEDVDEEFLERRRMQRGEEAWAGLVDRAVEAFERKGRKGHEEEVVIVDEGAHGDIHEPPHTSYKSSQPLSGSPRPMDLDVAVDADIDVWYFLSDLSGTDDSDSDRDTADLSECSSNDSWECL